MKTLLILSIGCLSVSIAAAASGKTTRYWDCCKASCSWSCKAPVSAPVQTCAKDGLESVDPNTANVCGGGGSAGKAYMCNDNQPFAINESLAFGFVAGAIAGQVESDW